MSNTLSEINRTRNFTGNSLVIEDYDKHFRLCRSGLWVGVENTFTETVTISYEHTGELYVGWRINGVTIVDPGYSSGTPPWGSPVPGVSGVTYKCPVDELFHRISFTSTSGMDQQCFYVQVLYRNGIAEAGMAPHPGPSLSVCISGREIEWPADKLEEEANCLKALFEKLRSYKLIRKVFPPDPIEWLGRFEGQEAQILEAMIDTYERVNTERQPMLSKMLEESIVNSLQAHALGSTRLKTITEAAIKVNNKI
jgi:hypothetical protein